MKSRSLKKLNRPRSAVEVESLITSCGYAPYHDGDIEGLTLMTIFKSRERHTRRAKKREGVYVKLQSFTSPEGAEDCDFIVLNADVKSGRKFSPGWYKMFVRHI